MKSTGIIRRIDDLGRVVIPKDLRLKFGLTEGISVEFYLDKHNNLILKKYDQKENWIQEHLDDFEDDERVMNLKIQDNICFISWYSHKDKKIQTVFSKPSKNDNFDERVGIAVAYAKTKNEDIPHFI